MSTAVSESDAESRAATIARLLSIWARTLRVSDISPASNFFDLGGDSLLAVALFLEIERETGVHFPITTIYDAPTVAEMANLILSNGRPEFSPLVLLKPGGRGAPLFVVHGIGGTVVELTTLAQHIRIPEPVYALQAQGIDGTRPPLARIEHMAELYLGCIRQMQPDGPYRLCGYSFGGLVALEMARRLGRLREEIALLVLMDAFAHPATWPVFCRAGMHIRRALHRLGEAAGDPWRKGLPVLRAGMGRALRWQGGSQTRTNEHLREWLIEKNPDLPLPLLQVREAGSAALACYVPRFYPGKITFLKAAHRDAEFPLDPVPIWRRLVADMEVHTVPGGHRTIVTEHAAAAGATLTACMHGATDNRNKSVRLGRSGRQKRFAPQAV